ncbi:MAG: AarF/ABC1/UbiB kinase family protein [Pseudomonadota bacterium]
MPDDVKTPPTKEQPQASDALSGQSSGTAAASEPSDITPFADTEFIPGESDGMAVPAKRVSRLARFGAMGAGVAGNMIVDGAKRIARGERPALNDLLLTPSNAQKVADQLSQLRGAAMKMGQLISMDSGDFIPPELADILGRLRQSAHSMPPAQLKSVLDRNWGRGWLGKFESFDPKPIAAASIGQVHRAKTKDGRDLAVKIQYPGVRDSIESDVDNVAALLKVARLTPDDVDITPLLAEAKRQLQEEADYEREGAHLQRYKDLLGASEDFILPEVYSDLTTKDVLAMSYVSGTPIEHLTDRPQEERDRVVSVLMTLMVREIYEFRLMQTDPNFANYFYDEPTGKIVLLDFGATREIPEKLSNGYKSLAVCTFKQDWRGARETAADMGLAGPEHEPEIETLLEEVFRLAMEPVLHEGPFDFGNTDLAVRLRDKGLALRTGGFVHVPPPATVFFHRKFGGSHLLATKLKARVDLGAIVRAGLE